MKKRKNTSQEDAVQQTEKYRTVFKIAPEVVALLDLNGNVIDVNGEMYNWLGYNKKDIIGKNIADLPLLDEEGKRKVKGCLPKKFSGNRTPSYEFDFFTKQGKKVMGRVIASLVRCKDRKPRAIVVMASDITKEKQMEKDLRQSEERLRSIINASPDAITITDLNAKIIDCDQATLDLHGFAKKEDVIGLSAFKFISPKDIQKAKANLAKTLSSGFVKNVEYTALDKNGNEFPLELSASLIRDSEGKPKFFMAVSRNISERKKLEQAKTEFVSLASHQLRTPLTAVNWYIETLLEGASFSPESKEKSYIEEIYGSTQQLIRLTDLLLNTSRIELGTFVSNPKKVWLYDVVTLVLGELSAEIKNKKLKIQKIFRESLFLYNDPDIVKIIFQNLLSNAVHYSRKGGKVKILIKKQNSKVVIMVKDNGFGIPQSQQKHIFDKFFRANNIQQKQLNGTGLGLYIVKSMVDKIGGKIWFTSKENKGATFYVALPINKNK